MTILIVDDEEIDRNGIAFLLQKFDFRMNTLAASNGAEALELIRRGPVDILFTDIRMPKLDGLQLVEKALEINPDLVVIIYSAYNEFDYAREAMGLGVRHYLLKPMVMPEFKKTMEEAIRECEGKRYNDLKSRIAELLLIGGKTMEFTEWTFGRCLLLIGFENPVLLSRNEDICRAAEAAAGEGAMAITLNEYQMVCFVSQERAGTAAGEILGCLSKRVSGRVTVVQGRPFASAEDLRRLYDNMEAMLDEMTFTAPGGLMKLEEKDEAAKSDQWIDTATQNILVRIDRKENVQAEIDLLFDRFKEEGHHSALYMKYIATVIARACFESAGSGHEVVRSYMEEILACRNLEKLRHILQEIAGQVVSPGENERVINQLIDLIERDYALDLSLDQLADRVCLTPNYLSFLFKRETGQNFVKYLTSVRIKKAQELLRETNYKIAAVGEMVGYINVSYFCLIFKNYCGMTPAQYREHSRLKDGTEQAR